METINPDIFRLLPEGWAELSKTDLQIRQTIRWMDLAYMGGRIDGTLKSPYLRNVPAPWEQPQIVAKPLPDSAKPLPDNGMPLHDIVKLLSATGEEC